MIVEYIGAVAAGEVISEISGMSKKAARLIVRASLETHPGATRVYRRDEAESLGKWWRENHPGILTARSVRDQLAHRQTEGWIKVIKGEPIDL